MIRFLMNFGGHITKERRYLPGEETNVFNTANEEYLIKTGKAERCVAPAPQRPAASKKTRKRAAKK